MEYTIRITGSGTREEIIESLKKHLESIQEEGAFDNVNPPNEVVYEDNILITTIDEL